MAVKQFQRFLYLSTDNQSFISGDSEFHEHYKLDKVPFIKDVLTESPDSFFSIIDSTIVDPLLPTKDTIFFSLAVATVTETNTNVKNQIYLSVQKHTKNDEDFFAYIKFKSKLKKTISSGLIKIIQKHYLEKTPEELWRTLGIQSTFHGWSHKDLMKLSHIKTDVKYSKVGIIYALKGYNEALKEAGDDKLALELLENVKKCVEFKKGQNVTVGTALLKELQLGHQYVPLNYRGSDQIWSILLEYMNIKDVILMLPHLQSSNLLTKVNPVVTKIQEILSDKKHIVESGIQPAEVFIGLRNFIKGGKAKDPQFIKYLNEIKPENARKRKIERGECVDNPTVIKAVKDCISLSCVNIVPTKKRFIITLAIDKHPSFCITNRNVTWVQAAAVAVYEIFKSEENVKVFVTKFHDSFFEVSPDKNDTLDSFIDKITEALFERETVEKNSTGNDCKTPYDYVEKSNEEFDVFLNINCSGLEKLNDIEKFNEIHQKSKSKLIICNFGSCKLIECPEYVLNVCGFDKNTLKVIRAFALNRF